MTNDFEFRNKKSYCDKLFYLYFELTQNEMLLIILIIIYDIIINIILLIINNFTQNFIVLGYQLNNLL